MCPRSWDHPVNPTRAAILVVDEQPEELRRVGQELRKRYGRDYQVIEISSGVEAADVLVRLKSSGHPVALVLAVQWMRPLTGTEVLGRVRALHPMAKRGLLVDWGDRAANQPLLEAMSLGAVDYFVFKPRVEPDEEFHHAVSGFLAEWARLSGRVFKAVHCIGDPNAPRSHELRDLLTRNGVPHEFLDADTPEARAELRRIGMGSADLPVVIVLDGPPMANPSNVAIADAFDVDTALDERFDVTIVGGGPAGLAAAVNAASEGLRTLIIEREAMGGQAATSSWIRNFLGFPSGISGSQLGLQAFRQAATFGAQFHLMRPATEVGVRGADRLVKLVDGTEIRSRAVVIATGVSYRRLGIESLERLLGAGVYYGAAVAEAPAMKGKEVFVAGAANSAGQAAVHLSRFASRVVVLVRGGSLSSSMSEYLIREIEGTPNITVLGNVEIVGGGGPDRLEHLVLRDTRSGDIRQVRAEALFVLIGAVPSTDWLPAGIRRDRWGFIETGSDLIQDGKLPEGWPLERPPLPLETSIPGVFAAGDVRQRSVKRVAAAVGEGARCIPSLHRYLEGEG
jgi:thioredoxin reductase (NADPH)